MALKYIAIIFLSAVEFGSSIRCYECNSANNSMCLEPSLYDPASVQKYLKSRDCEKILVLQPKAHQMFCRKIIQTILHKGHDAEVRVSRGCGWVKHARECYKADNDDHLETVCQCFTDDCNASPALRAGLALAVATLATAVFIQ